jgi:hypothetical protein
MKPGWRGGLPVDVFFDISHHANDIPQIYPFFHWYAVNEIGKTWHRTFREILRNLITDLHA